MPNLKLRTEFLGAHMPGTAITLRRDDKTGAVQQRPEQILSITYPTADVQLALRAISSERAKRPVVLMGDRGRGKSHIMAVVHHAVESPAKVESWAREWGERAASDTLRKLSLRGGFFPISEPVHNHEYPFLWDLIFDRHPKGEYFRGQFESTQHYFPPRSLLEQMFSRQPTVLILDEFQTWFEGLPERDSQGRKPREWASNFIQVLSELATDRPDLLILVVSLLNNQTDAFRQIHRNGPVLIDFRGPTAKQDRQRLVLHRLFDNRGQIPLAEIQGKIQAYASERFRLRFAHLADAERTRIFAEAAESWPFSPELIELLEDHILMSEAAQETRDLIRILAQVYRVRGGQVPLITPADFFVDDDSCGVQSLLDSIATLGEQEKLREVAQRNLETVTTLGVQVPHARELISALWMRSMSPGKNNGGTRTELQLDITRDAPLDDNAFQGELVELINGSINIHGEEVAEGRLRFGLEENPRTKVRSTARNDKLWRVSAAAVGAGQMAYPGEDIQHIRKTLRAVLVPDNKQPSCHVIVLGPDWRSAPWQDIIDDADHPTRWNQPILVVIPSPVDISDNNNIAALGEWLAAHVPRRRNTIRFLLPAAGARSIYEDDEIVFAARCSYLTSFAWKNDQKYRALSTEFAKTLRTSLQARFDRFAILRRWDFRSPKQCVFDVETIGAQGGDTSFKIEEKILRDFFDAAEFQRRVHDYARESWSVGRLLDELAEPPASSEVDAIPFLGDTAIYEELLKITAKGDIALNVGGAWVVRPRDVDDADKAYRTVRQQAFRSGQEQRAVELGLPGMIGGDTVPGPKPQPTTVTQWPAPAAPAPAESTLRNGHGEQGYLMPQMQPTSSDVSLGTMTGPVVQSKVRGSKTRKTDEPKTGINLSGFFEKWGMSTSARLTSAKIEFNNLSVQDLKQILQRIPPSFQAMLDVTYEEEE